jgi:hypothetical protein
MVDTFYFWPDLAITFWLVLALLHYDVVERRLNPRPTA